MKNELKTYIFPETTVTIEIDPDKYAGNEIYKENIDAEARYMAEDPGDYGQCPDCPTGRIHYHGGSMYFCTHCQQEYIRKIENLEKFQNTEKRHETN